MRQFIGAQLALLAGCRARVDAASTPTVKVGGVKYVQLTYVSRLYTMSISGSGRQLVLKNKFNTLEFKTNGADCKINGVKVWMHDACVMAGRQWAIRELDFKKVIDPVLRSYAYVPPRMPRLVMLDPGHGGHDSGAIGPKGTKEKDVAYSVAQRVKAYLEVKGVKVRISRPYDTYLTLEQRSALAATVKADLFVSIHADGFDNPSANGVETFVLTAAGRKSTNDAKKVGNVSVGKGNAYDSANAVLGYSIQSNLLKNTKRADRGLKRARFSVIKNVSCPAALVECGFVTNPAEETLMMGATYREAAARGISNGILGYLTQLKRAAQRK